MSGLVFAVPEDGSEVAAPDPDWLRERVLHGGATFWCSGSGQGWLRHSDGTALLISFAEGCGFYLEFIDSKGQYWHAVFPHSAAGKVPVWIGGDPIIVSKQFIVSPELAWSEVEQFCRDGHLADAVPWARRSSVSWDFSWWNHPEVALK
jgi:hypothetical protein